MELASCLLLAPRISRWLLEFVFLIRAPLLKTVVFQLVVYVESLWLNLNFCETTVKKE